MTPTFQYASASLVTRGAGARAGACSSVIVVAPSGAVGEGQRAALAPVARAAGDRPHAEAIAVERDAAGERADLEADVDERRPAVRWPPRAAALVARNRRHGRGIMPRCGALRVGISFTDGVLSMA
ncbi:MAG: hypothetical protein H6713_26020 [Myxococcales bacterium]|nr:hypothetical protein [Myxococcales bacterium]